MEPIDRQAAIDAIRADPMGGLNYARILKDLPTADVVEVVRRKDCKHRPVFRNDEDGDRHVEGPRYPETLKNGHTFMFEDGTCPCVNEWDSYFSYVPKDDWFCANGERRTEE